MTHVAPTPFGRGGLFGGGERYPLELGRALASDVECHLVTFGERPYRLVDPSGLRVTVLPIAARLYGHPAHPVGRGLFRALEGSDVVHGHHLRALPTNLSALWGLARRRPVAVTDHGLQLGRWGVAAKPLVDRFLTVSEYSARQLGAPRSRTRVVYGGADPKRFRPDPAATRRGVLFVGRITPHKGLDRLIRALPDGAPLRVIGTAGHDPRPPESGYPELVRRLAHGRDVEFSGDVPDEELAAAYRHAQVLALPSVDVTVYGRRVRVPELLGLTALEAMASGTPVVATRLPAFSEIVADGETGFLAEPGDIEGLRERLELLLGDTRLAQRLGANAREAVLERFTWRACAERCLAAYEEMLGRSGRERLVADRPPARVRLSPSSR